MEIPVRTLTIKKTAATVIPAKRAAFSFLIFENPLVTARNIPTEPIGSTITKIPTIARSNSSVIFRLVNSTIM